MYFSPLKALVCLASFAVVSTSMPLRIEQSRHNAASDAWSNLPLKASIPVERIHFEFSQNKVYQMHESLRYTRTSDPDGYDNEQRHWIALASEGLSEINGPCLENEVNRHPQFNASVTVDGHTSNVHFMALFSQQPDAIPIVFLHGWPGSFLDFTELLDLVRQKYSSEDCPFHLIVPSLPGYAYSAGSPMSRHADMVAVARTIDALLTGIGLDNGYIAQGGGVGAYVARLLGSSSPSCEDLSEQDLEILSRASHFKSLQKTDVADHGKQVTLGVVSEKDPLSLLACLDAPDNMIPFVPKPMGYSRFPFDISGLPRKWAATLGDLVWYNSHVQGGHFAAMENPEELWNDVEHFVRTVFPDDLPR
ncbi:hypothetical protein APSETT445_007430 [Aspergillus pseudonomiae]